MITTDADRELGRLIRNLQDYTLVSKYTFSEVLEKKGNDLRIQLFKLFWDQKFGGPGKRKADVAFRELARRTRAGLGTLVRKLFLDSEVGTPPERSASGRKLSLWQKLVWQEVQRRAHGMGLIAIGLLSKRYRTRAKRDSAGKIVRDASGLAMTERWTDVNRSRQLGELVQITKTEDSYSIRGMTPGMGDVAQRYGIYARAMAKVSEDMEPYLARKFGQAYRSSFKS